LGKIENILNENILSHIHGTSLIEGTQEQAIKNIRINDMQNFMNPEDAINKRAIHALKIENAGSLKISDLSVDRTEDEVEKKWQSVLVLKIYLILNSDGFRDVRD
jgi:hypothetical protein